MENLAEHLWTLLVIVDGKWPLPGRRCDEDRGAGTTATPAGSGRGDRTPRKGAQVELRCHAEPGPIAVLTFWSPNCSICWASRTGASVITNGDHSSLPEVGRRGLLDLVASGAQRVRRVVQSGRYGGIGVCPSNSRSTATLRPSRGPSGGGGVGCHHESRTSGRARTGRLTRIEPAMSVPCAIAPIPTATAAAAPPLEPPGVSAGSQGFSASGREVVVAEPAEGKGRHVRPADDDRAAGSEIHDRRTASAEML